MLQSVYLTLLLQLVLPLLLIAGGDRTISVIAVLVASRVFGHYFANCSTQSASSDRK